MTDYDLHDDDQLLAALGAALAEADPIPEAAHAAALAAFDLGALEGELAEVVADSLLDRPLAGVRHDGDADRYLEVRADALTVEIDLPAHSTVVVGRLDPPGPGQVLVELTSASGAVERVTLPVDELGRFEGDVGPGSLRLHVTTGSGPVTTPWIVR